MRFVFIGRRVVEIVGSYQAVLEGQLESCCGWSRVGKDKSERTCQIMGDLKTTIKMLTFPLTETGSY